MLLLQLRLLLLGQTPAPPPRLHISPVSKTVREPPLLLQLRLLLLVRTPAPPPRLHISPVSKTGAS